MKGMRVRLDVDFMVLSVMVLSALFDVLLLLQWAGQFYRMHCSLRLIVLP
jgi:hypothetical protein